MPNRRMFFAGVLSAVALPAIAQTRKPASDTGGALTRARRIDGQYVSAGINADGTRYNGVARITQDGNTMTITWIVNGEESRGSGAIDGRVVTVDWGQKYPAIYVIMEDGTLHGTFANGTALEKLTPR